MTPEIRLVFLVMIFAAVFSFAQGVVGLIRVGRAKSKVNRRLTTARHTASISDLVIELRKQRGLDASGKRKLALRWLADLVMASGLVYRPKQWLTLLAAAAVVASLGLVVVTHSLAFAPLGPLTVAAVGVIILKVAAARRAKALGEQLPNGLDIIVRSLEAGHPVPTAIALVGREMVDPIGTEFGMMSDEIAYGASLEQAVGRMAERCRHPDLDLFAATIRLQERAGGNLTSLLKLNSKTVRDRHKMRLKIKAASSEGRVSAIILTVAPFAVMAVLTVASPGYYTEVLQAPIGRYWFAGFGLWMVVGNLVMRRMINMKV